jgi:hypothetical protein
MYILNLFCLQTGILEPMVFRSFAENATFAGRIFLATPYGADGEDYLTRAELAASLVCP